MCYQVIRQTRHQLPPPPFARMPLKPSNDSHVRSVDPYVLIVRHRTSSRQRYLSKRGIKTQWSVNPSQSKCYTESLLDAKVNTVRSSVMTTSDPSNFKIYTVDLVIFACLDFYAFIILRLFVMSRICELLMSMIGGTIITTFVRLLNSRISPPGEIRKN